MRFQFKSSVSRVRHANSRRFKPRNFECFASEESKRWFLINQPTDSLKNLLDHQPLQIVQCGPAVAAQMFEILLSHRIWNLNGTIVASVVRPMSRRFAGTHSNEGFDHGQRYWHH
ncbi:hypothetical protein RBSWK_00597 [Rhodopirellula baltica SWK14]|uniref:Uncharacterized protein n=1 Tax=Rhodopirellula baltica SWK14 TaxID=993516 RepID=L7CMG9_RHOBT|nr:hypothetical protein RBSWK_00597 [Rhodopirellula baltica SWK14]